MRRESLRVTRLRDLVEISPHVWEEYSDHSPGSVSELGSKQGQVFKELLLESPHFRVYSYNVLPSGEHSVKFLMGSPRMDSLDDVSRVTTVVANADEGLINLVPETNGSGFVAGGPTVDAAPEAVVLDTELRPVEPGSGVPGRLARGGHIPLRYHNDPEKTAATFVTAADGNRYAVAGDNVLLEADGSITLLGRDSVCINSGGEKIFTEEVEAVVKAHPDVYDAIIVGVPDDRWGQRVAAVAQPRAGAVLSLESIDAHCRNSLAGYKVPRELHVVEHVERSEAGKPNYRWAKAVATDHPT